MRLILAIMLFASVAVADEYAVVFIPETVSVKNLDQAMKNIKDIGKDANTIDTDKMPIWFEKSDTNLTGRICCIRVDGMGVNDWKEMPLAQVETRVTADVEPPDKKKITVMSREDLFADYDTIQTDIP